eukprot:161260-Prymnesium_polylepis.1
MEPPWRSRWLASGRKESLRKSDWGRAALHWNITTHQTSFKYEDYFHGVSRDPVHAYSLQEAIDVMKAGDLAPRLSVAELLTHAKRFIRTFPFSRVCANISALPRARTRQFSSDFQAKVCGCSSHRSPSVSPPRGSKKAK